MNKRIARVRQTDRLRLEPIGSHHAEDLFRLHIDEKIAQWFDGPWTREHARARARSFESSWEVDGISKWMAYDLRTGDLVGRGGLSRWDFEGHRHLELGWALRGDWHGKGYATEMGRAGLDVAFQELGAELVYAFTEPENEPSRAVMDRLGMSFVRDIVYEDKPFVLYQSTRR